MYAIASDTYRVVHAHEDPVPPDLVDEPGPLHKAHHPGRRVGQDQLNVALLVVLEGARWGSAGQGQKEPTGQGM